VRGYRAVYKVERDAAVIYEEDSGEGTLIEIPDVRIDGVVGSGANGIVFSAWDALDREVAVKVYPPRLDKDREIYEIHEQAMSEARKIASLKHPAIATVYRYGRLDSEYWSPGWWPDDGWPYCVMEMRSGEPLRDVLPKIEEDLETRRSILRQILEA
jgi:serine/threonine protein kinase